MDKKEKTKKLLVVIGVLKETAVRFRTLNRLAINELRSGYSNFCRDRLEEVAKLLVALPGRLFWSTIDFECKISNRIIADIYWFANSAKEAMKETKPDRLLRLLRVLPDYKIDDENSLESLICWLEGELH